MRKNLFLLALSMLIGGNLVAMEENDPLPPTPRDSKEVIGKFLVAQNKGRASVRALVTPRGEGSDASIIFRSDFRKVEFEAYQQHVAPSIMKDEFVLKTNNHLYIDEPIPTTLLLSGPDRMRPGLLAKTLAQLLDADFQEILHWRAKGTLDLMKGFALTGEEKRDKVIFIRDIALLGRDLQGIKETAHAVLYDQVKNSIKAIQQRKNQVDHRVYVIASTAYEESLPDDIKTLFEKTYALSIPDEGTAAAIVGNFVTSLNGVAVPLDEKCVSSLKDFDFDDLKCLVTEAAKRAVCSGKKAIDLDNLEQALQKTREVYGKARADRIEMAKILAEGKKIVARGKEVESDSYERCVLEQVPKELYSLCEHSVALPLYYHDARVYVLTGERGLGKMTLARALADRRNAELVIMSAEELLDPIVGKTQKNVESFFDGLKQRDKKGESCVVMLRGIERLVPANKYGDEVYEMSALRASLLNSLKKVGEYTVLLLCADAQRDRLHSELIATVGSERCAEFVKPKDGALKAALIKRMCDRLIKQKELSVDFTVLADKAEAFTCADIENMVRSAGRKAIMDNAQAVTSEHFERALGEVQKIVKEREGNSSLSHCYI